jgi:hypothetical protein
MLATASTPLGWNSMITANTTKPNLAIAGLTMSRGARLSFSRLRAHLWSVSRLKQLPRGRRLTDMPSSPIRLFACLLRESVKGGPRKQYDLLNGGFI